MHFTNRSLSRDDGDTFEPLAGQQGGDMAIAIIGMSCKFPGDATSPEALWKLCEEGRSAWSEIPCNRFNKDAFYHPSGDKTTTTNVTGGHFLEEDIGLFDASFFNMTPEVAATMDPQCRLQLESVYEALENSGLSMDEIADSQTAVFSGAFYKDYMDSLMRDPEELPRYVMTGNGATMMANRISHFYNLRGPSMTVDTGCSTGLTALHQACQSLKTSDARMAIVVGANIMINPDIFVLWSSLGFLSPDGKCYSFDSRASGYGRGEGVATVVLKPLNEAVRDGDPIRAVIAQTALNQDGKTQTITSPSQTAQEELIRLCYEKAGLDPTETAYVEAHGTGTKAGDPTEAAAIHAVMSKGCPRAEPLYLGSVKSNIGHLETASGLAAIIKVALALEKGLIPPSINFEVGNENIPFNEWNLKIPRKLEPWPVGFPRRASINNFGYGGANAHVIIEAWQPYLGSTMDNLKITSPIDSPGDSYNESTASSSVCNDEDCFDKEEGTSTNTPINSVSVNSEPEELSAIDTRVLLLSTKDEAVIQSMVKNLKEYVANSEMNDDQLISRLAHTLGHRRSNFPWRIALSFQATKDGLLSALNDSAKLLPTRSMKAPKIGFVFTGQGAQWYAMGRELIGVYPVFAATLQEADQHLRDMDCPWSLLNELTKNEAVSRVNDVVLSPPLCIAVQIGLVRLLESWGIKPTAMTSHSSGEIAAAYAAGLINLREAMAIVFARGAFLESLQEKAHYRGAMIVAGIGRDEAESFISRMGTTGRTVVACVNSPSSVTISGDHNAIARLEEKLTEDKIFVRALKVPVAYHSHHMNPVAEDYLAALKKVLRKEREFIDVHYTSPVTGGTITDASAIGPEHWVHNMLQPVLFVDSLSAMCLSSSNSGEQVIDTIVEVGPHGALSGPIRQTLKLSQLKDLGITYGSCLWRAKNAVSTMHDLAASLVAKGYPVNLDAVNFPQQTGILRALGDLPSYPWNHRTRYWYESRINRAHRNKELPSHDLLGSRVLGSSPTNPTWRHFIRPSEVPWVRDHQVQSDIVYPGAGLISMALEAMRQIAAVGGKLVTGFSLSDVEILQALVIPDTARGIEVQLTFQNGESKTLGLKGWRAFSICSIQGDDSWTEHCRGLITPEFTKTAGTDVTLHNDDTHFAPEHPDAIFGFFRSVGIFHGESFKNLRTVKAAAGRSITTFAVADSAASMPAQFQQAHLIHPTTLDSVIVAAYSSLPGCGTRQKSGMVPRSIKRMFISADIDRAPGDLLQAHSSLLQDDEQGFHASVAVSNGSSLKTAIEIDDLYCISIGAAVVEMEAANRCLKVEWAEDLSLTSMSDFTERLKAPPNAEEFAIVQELNQACFYFFHHTVTFLSKSDVKGLLWYHKMYYEWMKLQIAQQPKAHEWLSAGAEEKSALIERVADSSTSGNMVCRIGRNLVGILRQEIAPLELMLKDQLLHRYYQEALHIGSSYQQAYQIVDLFAHKNAQAKVLEIGGGTGGCTQHVLRALGGGDTDREARFSHYDFTDVSVNFFDEARNRFSAWGELVEYRRLDIESDPVGQGYERGTYDLIVACQVLHATKNIDTTMSHVRSLLKPGGKLVLVETTHDSHDIQLIFGVLPGWWLSEEPERKQSPSLSVDLWGTVLQHNGFSGPDLRVRDCEDDDKYVIDVLISTALPEVSDIPRGQVAVICSQQEQPPRPWLDQLLRDIKANSSIEPTLESIESAQPDGKFCIVLDGVADSILASPNHAEFLSVKRIVTKALGLVWVSYGGAIDCENPVSALHSGFLRTLRCEDTSKRYVSLDLEYHNGYPWSSRAAEAITQISATAFGFTQASTSMDFEYALRRDSIMIPRVHEDREKTEVLALDKETVTSELQPFYQPGCERRLEVAVPGMLDSLTFKDDLEACEVLPDGFIDIEPRAFGLNFRDVMVAMGQLQTKIMGFECSGVVTRVGPNVPPENGLVIGARVCSLLRGHWANHTRIHWTSVAKIPQTMSFEVAASIPIVFITAYYSLYHLANIRKGETILIHSAAGGAGQAAIQFAQLAGAEIFATVGSTEKEDFIAKQYGIPRENIFSSRDTSFAQSIRRRTKGNGVDVVLNSLAGELLHETWTCIAPFGRFVEIGKRDFEQNNSLQMAPFVRAASFFAFDLFQLGILKPYATSDAFQAVMDLFRTDRLKPVAPISTFPISQLEKAFRTMQAGKHLGKIVIVPHADDLVKTQRLRVKLSPQASYLVVGGVGGIGKSVVRRVVELGARNLVLFSRNAESPKHGPFLAEVRAKGVKIVARDVDIADAAGLEAAARDVDAVLPPVRGIIQAAMVLQDSIVENMTHEDYLAAVRPKVQGTWNLHKQFQNLDFFIMLSSLVGMGGNSSQSNYAAGGSFEDALARYRSARNLPAVCLDLGMVASVGFVARTEGVKERLARQGYKIVSEDEVLKLVEDSIASPRRLSKDSQILVGVSSDMSTVSREDSPFLSDMRFSSLKRETTASSSSGSTKQGARSLQDLNHSIASADSWDQAVSNICQAIVGKLSAMFSLPEDEVDPSASMSHYGVDSLVAVELRNWLSSASQSDISIFDIMQSKSLVSLATVACVKSKLVPGKLNPS